MTRAGTILGWMLTVAIGVSGVSAQVPTAAPGDWPWWRGPNFNGVAESNQQPPTAWNEKQNVAWKTAIPGRGHSTPIVVGGRVFLQTADDKQRTQSVLCFDRQSGRVLWNRELNRGNLTEKVNRKNTHASSTIACDDGHLFVLFCNNDAIQVTVLNLDGKTIWKKAASPFLEKKYSNGYAASPVLYGNSVIIACDCEAGGKIMALDRKNGKTLWSTKRPGMTNYASPIVGHVSGRDQLLIGGLKMVASYDPNNGKMLWSSPALSIQTSGTLVWSRDMVFAAGGFPEGSTAGVKADGSGEIAWKNTHRLHEQSLLIHEGHVYAINDRGIALCWQARTGKEIWRHRLRGPISASPTLVDGNIYAINELGTAWVFPASPKGFQLISKNQLGTIAFASPTICGSEIFLRVADMVDEKRLESLYCLKRTSKP